jgi:hypothetical protein
MVRPVVDLQRFNGFTMLCDVISVVTEFMVRPVVDLQRFNGFTMVRDVISVVTEFMVRPVVDLQRFKGFTVKLVSGGTSEWHAISITRMVRLQLQQYQP